MNIHKRGQLTFAINLRTTKKRNASESLWAEIRRGLANYWQCAPSRNPRRQRVRLRSMWIRERLSHDLARTTGNVLPYTILCFRRYLTAKHHRTGKVLASGMVWRFIADPKLGGSTRFSHCRISNLCSIPTLRRLGVYTHRIRATWRSSCWSILSTNRMSIRISQTCRSSSRPTLCLDELCYQEGRDF